jgi:hypothetical protein
MSPTIIAILTLSSCALLIMLLFALRKRGKKKTMDLPALEGLKFDEKITLPDITTSAPLLQLEDILSLVSRYRFFQGKNLEQFEAFLRSGDLQKIEQLIIEKFSAQGKTEADQLGRTISTKLLNSGGI